MYHFLHCFLDGHGFSLNCVDLSIQNVDPCDYKPSLMITCTPSPSRHFSCIIITRVNITINVSRRWMPPLLHCIVCLLLNTCTPLLYSTKLLSCSRLKMKIVKTISRTFHEAVIYLYACIYP
jgi:hypothetical protein